MLRVNTRDGKSHTFDLLTNEGGEAWARARVSHEFQSAITGLCITRHGATYALPVPSGFARLLFDAELARDASGAPVAIKATCFADELAVSLLVYLHSAVSRTHLERKGRPRWTPAGVPVAHREPRPRHGG